MKVFKQAMEVAYKWVDFRIVFLLQHIGYWPNLDNLKGYKCNIKCFNCFRDPEVERDKLILCANFINPKAQLFFPYIYCLGLNATAPVDSEHVRGCALEHGYSVDELEVRTTYRLTYA